MTELELWWKLIKKYFVRLKWTERQNLFYLFLQTTQTINYTIRIHGLNYPILFFKLPKNISICNNFLISMYFQALKINGF